MPLLRLYLTLTLLLFPALLLAAEDTEWTETLLTRQQYENALLYLKSERPEKRKVGYRGYRKLGTRAKALYERALLDARAHHGDALTGLAQRLGEAREVADILERHKTLQMNRAKTLGELFKNFGDNKRGLKALDEKVQRVGKLLMELERALDRFESPMRHLKARGTALAEIARELDYCGSREASQINTLEQALQDLGTGENLLRLQRISGEINADLKFHRETTAYNDGLRWAAGDAVTFAEKLNRYRHDLGLTPLRLEEHLCSAAFAHSEEMRVLAYFSHESPVEENRSPARRAGNAGFAGRFLGENIYWRNVRTDPQIAFVGWWNSDGHRKIMFGRSANALGVGTAEGTHWTMLMGNRRDWRRGDARDGAITRLPTEDAMPRRLRIHR